MPEVSFVYCGSSSEDFNLKVAFCLGNCHRIDPSPKCMLKIVKFTDVFMTGGFMHTPSHTNVCKFFNFQHTFSQLIFHVKC